MSNVYDTRSNSSIFRAKRVHCTPFRFNIIIPSARGCLHLRFFLSKFCTHFLYCPCFLHVFVIPIIFTSATFSLQQPGGYEYHLPGYNTCFSLTSGNVSINLAEASLRPGETPVIRYCHRAVVYEEREGLIRSKLGS